MSPHESMNDILDHLFDPFADAEEQGAVCGHLAGLQEQGGCGAR